MQSSFKLIIENPAWILRVGKSDQVIQIAAAIQDAVHFEDESYLEITALYTSDSSYVQGEDFRFPVKFYITRLTSSNTEQAQEKLGTARIVFWKKDDETCLIRLAKTNKPEDNIECDYQTALRLITERLQKELS